MRLLAMISPPGRARPRRHPVTLALALAALSAAGSCGGEPEASPPAEEQPRSPATDQRLVVYSGRGEELIGPLLEEFEEESGIDLEVRYADTAELAATILDEGDRSPADVFLAQDAGALGAVASEDRLAAIPSALLERVPAPYRDPEGRWIGLSGRSRVVVYSPERTTAEELPESIFELTEPRFKDQVAWAPTNGSFQAFVTGLRLLSGEDKARQWLAGMVANGVKAYPNNVSIVQAVAAGEVELGLANHYYALELAAQQENFGAVNHFLADGDPGALLNVSGGGILATSEAQPLAERLLEFLLSERAQRYFQEETFEYPLAAGVQADPRLPPVDQLRPPQVDLSELSDLRRTLEMLSEVGVT